jgi:hypothetical protein
VPLDGGRNESALESQVNKAPGRKAHRAQRNARNAAIPCALSVSNPGFENRQREAGKCGFKTSHDSLMSKRNLGSAG